MQELPDRIQQLPRTGSVSYYCLFFTPAPFKAPTLALYALCRELDLARDATDPGVARLKLQWWREELSRAANHAARHPVTQELAAAHLSGIGELISAVEHRERELSHQSFVTEADFDRWADQGPGTILRTWAGLLSPHDTTDWRTCANTLALALQRLDALHRTRTAALRGTILHPRERLAQHNVDATALAQNQPGASLAKLVESQRQLAGTELEQALAQWPRPDRKHHAPLLVMADLRLHTLREQLASHPGRIDERVVLTPVRKLWQGWRRARRER